MLNFLVTILTRSEESQGTEIMGVVRKVQKYDI